MMFSDTMGEKSRVSISNWCIQEQRSCVSEWMKNPKSLSQTEMYGKKRTFLFEKLKKKEIQLRISMDKNKGWLSSIQLPRQTANEKRDVFTRKKRTL